MSTPTPETIERITEAAEYRVKNESWKQIAQRYQYASDATACSTLTQEHPQLWKEAYAKARQAFLDELEITAASRQVVLSQQSYNLAVAQSASHSLLAHTAKLRAQEIKFSGEISLAHDGSIAIGDMTPEQLAARARVLLDGKEDRG